MDIKGPAGTPPVDNEPITVKPGSATSLPTHNPRSSSPSVQVQLSPSLFKLGQLLDVIVAKVERDALLLLLQNKVINHKGEPLAIQFRAPKVFDAKVGQQLTVQVTNIRNNQPELAIVAVNKTAAELQASLQRTAQVQKPVQHLLEHLLAVKQLKPETINLPTAIREQVDRLWRSLPDASQIQKPDNLRQAMQYAGPFLESNLLKSVNARNRVIPELDIRGQLLRLAESLRQQQQVARPATTAAETSPASQPQAQPRPPIPPVATPPLPTGTPSQSTTASSSTSSSPAATTTPTKPESAPVTRLDPRLPVPPQRVDVRFDLPKLEQLLTQLLQQSDSGLARMQHQQLLMAQAETRPQWILELPVKHGDDVDVFDMRIHPDAEQHRDKPDRQQPWTVMLAFNLEGLGPVRAQISLYNGQISTYWWAEQPQTVSLFHQHISHLQNRLQHAGVPIDKVSCECGIPKADAVQGPVQSGPYSSKGLDEQV